MWRVSVKHDRSATTHVAIATIQQPKLYGKDVLLDLCMFGQTTRQCPVRHRWRQQRSILGLVRQWPCPPSDCASLAANHRRHCRAPMTAVPLSVSCRSGRELAQCTIEQQVLADHTHAPRWLLARRPSASAATHRRRRRCHRQRLTAALELEVSWSTSLRRA